jgi:hypothetical protein
MTNHVRSTSPLLGESPAASRWVLGMDGRTCWDRLRQLRRGWQASKSAVHARASVRIRDARRSDPRGPAAGSPLSPSLVREPRAPRDRDKPGELTAGPSWSHGLSLRARTRVHAGEHANPKGWAKGVSGVPARGLSPSEREAIEDMRGLWDSNLAWAHEVPRPRAEVPASERIISWSCAT